ncbi:MAG: leucine-rich repeat protein [Ruminococcus sp.]
MIKKFSLIAAVFFVLSALAVSSVSGITYYLYNGYLYRDITTSTIALSGYEGSETQLVVPETIGERTLISIDGYAFYGNSTVTEIDLSQATGLSAIGEGAFCECSSLKNAVIPSSVNSISEMAFQDCSLLEIVQFDATVNKINRQMFMRCSALTEFTVPETVNAILDYAFANCSALERIVIPSSVTSISDVAFLNDSNLTIYGFEGSYAQTYAQEHNIPFVLIETYMLGDANGDGYVNISDVTDIQRAVAEMDTLDDLRKKAADVNGDGVVTIDDATFLQTYLAEFETAYPIGEVTAQ